MAMVLLGRFLDQPFHGSYIDRVAVWSCYYYRISFLTSYGEKNQFLFQWIRWNLVSAAHITLSVRNARGRFLWDYLIDIPSMRAKRKSDQATHLERAVVEVFTCNSDEFVMKSWLYSKQNLFCAIDSPTTVKLMSISVVFCKNDSLRCGLYDIWRRWKKTSNFSSMVQFQCFQNKNNETDHPRMSARRHFWFIPDIQIEVGTECCVILQSHLFTLNILLTNAWLLIIPILQRSIDRHLRDQITFQYGYFGFESNDIGTPSSFKRSRSSYVGRLCLTL